MILSLCLKCAFNKICSKYKNNLQIIDESFNCIDTEKLLKIGELLEMVKKNFENVIIITHDETILDNSKYQNINIILNDKGEKEFIKNF